MYVGIWSSSENQHLRTRNSSPCPHSALLKHSVWSDHSPQNLGSANRYNSTELPIHYFRCSIWLKEIRYLIGWYSKISNLYIAPTLALLTETNLSGILSSGTVSASRSEVWDSYNISPFSWFSLYNQEHIPLLVPALVSKLSKRHSLQNDRRITYLLIWFTCKLYLYYFNLKYFLGLSNKQTWAWCMRPWLFGVFLKVIQFILWWKQQTAHHEVLLWLQATQKLSSLNLIQLTIQDRNKLNDIYMLWWYICVVTQTRRTVRIIWTLIVFHGWGSVFVVRAVAFRTKFRKHWEAASRPLSPAGTAGDRARVPVCPRRPVTRISYVCK